MHNAAELRNKNRAELVKDMLDLRKEHFNLRMQSGSGAAVKTHRFKEIRRAIARIKTILAQLKSDRG
jgi:large subunit ribosomal protein L29